MNNIERFKAVCAGKKPDYVPIFGLPGAPGMAGGALLLSIHQQLIKTGMPDRLDGYWAQEGGYTTELWHRYWGTAGPVNLDFFPSVPPQGFKLTKRVEDGYEIVESESGAVTRQVIDSDDVYSMPEYLVYDIRDRESWEFYKERMTPGPMWPAEKIEAECKKYNDRTLPLRIRIDATWGCMRGLVGPETACTILYDNPELAHEIIDFHCGLTEKYLFPIIERLKPEIVIAAEDCCYNHGMFISPKHFEEFCAPYYRKVGDAAKACGVDMAAIDTDGNIADFLPLVETCGMNTLFPCEVKSDNDLFALREKHPSFILMGWLEKECVNAGNEDMIEPEIMSKVPPLLEKGRYFPNGDHCIQPMVTFENLCKFMTLLHEVTGNPEGEFPRSS